MLALIFTAGLFWVVKQEYIGVRVPATTRPLFIIAVVFSAYIVLQIVPLPSAVIGLISPVTAQMRDYYTIAPRQFVPLSFDPYKTINELLRAAAFFIVFFISSVAFTDREKLKKMLTVLMLFGFCIAVFAIVQKATWNEKIYWFRELTAGGTPFGPFVNRNHFAGFAGMLVPLGLGYTLTQVQREKKILFGFLTVIIAISLFFSLSRGGIISFLAGMALFSLLVVLTRVQKKMIWSIVFFLIIVAAYLLYLGIDPVIERFYKTDVTREDRIIVWSATLSAYRDFWLTGTGLGTFIDAFPLYASPELRGIFDHAHNDYLEFILETGAIGATLLLSFLTILASSVYTAVKANHQSRRSMIRIGLISSVFVMLVHSIFDFNLHILSNALLFAVVLGMLSSLTLPAQEKFCKRRVKSLRELPGQEIPALPDGEPQEDEWEEERTK
jgi:O-antigen ligase